MTSLVDAQRHGCGSCRASAAQCGIRWQSLVFCQRHGLGGCALQEGLQQQELAVGDGPLQRGYGQEWLRAQADAAI